jgi:ribosome-associated translation inhibitor RaiA
VKLVLQHLHQNSSKPFSRLVRQQLEELKKSLRIDEARVLLERRPEASPPFRVTAHLVTPGPDVFGEAQDHTLAAALRKTVAQLARRIAQRHEKRARHARSHFKSGLRLVSAGARS